MSALRREQLIEQAKAIRSKTWTICKETDNDLKHAEKCIANQIFKAGEHFDHGVAECLISDAQNERKRCHESSVTIIKEFDNSLDLIQSGLLSTEEIERVVFQMAMKAKKLAS